MKKVYNNLTIINLQIQLHKNFKKYKSCFAMITNKATFT